MSVIFISGCGNRLDYAYDVNNKINAYNVDIGKSADSLKPFAQNLCVTESDLNVDSIDMAMAHSAGLFGIDSKETLYAKNVHDRMNPASLTKVMTALVALKYGNLEDLVTASNNVKINESGAQVCGFKEGDKVTLEQALYGLILYSGNDAAIMIAEYISGSVSSFAALMNEEAQALGATNTHFTNPHGLTDENHYTTAYDLYLIFNEAVKYDKFIEIINKDSYEFSYSDREGNIKSLEFTTTNLFNKGSKSIPGGVTVIGGKTGTTTAAGSCLILLSQNESGNYFISIVLKATDKDSLYNEMTFLLDAI